ncbi:hypothetical protein ISS21_00980 [Patescibacteria group bacterium]|nr:hypothetical protein [Patescibacteria group bacterium]
MRIKVDSNISISADKLIKRCGYAEIKDRQGRVSYVRRLRGYQYPRFHVYIKENFFNLHLDQKAPSYQGSSAHSGEYQGEVLEKEAERIKRYIKKIKRA